MKKIRMAMAALAAAACLGMSAQNVQSLGEAPREGEPYWGLRLGLDLSTLTGNPYQIAPGFHVGAVYNYPVTIGSFQGLYIEPGASLYFDRWGIDKSDIVIEDMLPGVEITGQDFPRYKIKSAYMQTWGLRIPVMAGLRFSGSPALNFTLATGPEVSIGFQNKQHLDVKIEDMDVNTSQTVYGDYGSMHRADLAWKFALGMNYYRLHLDIYASLGITDMQKDLPEGWDNSRLNRFGVTLGYNF